MMMRRRRRRRRWWRRRTPMTRLIIKQILNYITCF